MPRIKAVWGDRLPIVEAEVTCGAAVGYDGATQIVERIEFGLLWFDVFVGGQLDRSINAQHVAEVHYFDNDGAAP